MFGNNPNAWNGGASGSGRPADLDSPGSMEGAPEGSLHSPARPSGATGMDLQNLFPPQQTSLLSETLRIQIKEMQASPNHSGGTDPENQNEPQQQHPGDRAEEYVPDQAHQPVDHGDESPSAIASRPQEDFMVDGTYAHQHAGSNTDPLPKSSNSTSNHNLNLPELQPTHVSSFGSPLSPHSPQLQPPAQQYQQQQQPQHLPPPASMHSHVPTRNRVSNNNYSDSSGNGREMAYAAEQMDHGKLNRNINKMLPPELGALFHAQGADQLFVDKIRVEKERKKQMLPPVKHAAPPPGMSDPIVSSLAQKLGLAISPHHQARQEPTPPRSPINRDPHAGVMVPVGPSYGQEDRAVSPKGGHFGFAELRALEHEKEMLQSSVEYARKQLMEDEGAPMSLLPHQETEFLRINAEKAELQKQVDYWKTHAERLEDRNRQLERDVERITGRNDELLKLANEMDTELATVKRPDLKQPSMRILELHAEKQEEFQKSVTQMDVARPHTPEEDVEKRRIRAVNQAVKEQFKQLVDVDLDRLVSQRGSYHIPGHSHITSVQTKLDAEIETLERAFHLSEAKRYQTSNDQLLLRRQDLVFELKKVEARIAELDDQLESNRAEMEKHSTAEKSCESRAVTLENRLVTLADEEAKFKELYMQQLERERAIQAQLKIQESKERAREANRRLQGQTNEEQLAERARARARRLHAERKPPVPKADIKSRPGWNAF